MYDSVTFTRLKESRLRRFGSPRKISQIPLWLCVCAYSASWDLYTERHRFGVRDLILIRLMGTRPFEHGPFKITATWIDGFIDHICLNNENAFGVGVKIHFFHKWTQKERVFEFVRQWLPLLKNTTAEESIKQPGCSIGGNRNLLAPSKWNANTINTKTIGIESNSPIHQLCQTLFFCGICFKWYNCSFRCLLYHASLWWSI